MELTYNVFDKQSFKLLILQFIFLKKKKLKSTDETGMGSSNH